MTAALTSQQPEPPSPEAPSTVSESADDAADEDEFLDPIMREVIVDPVVGNDGCTYDRFTAYQLMTQGSSMPCCDEPFRICVDNLHFRSRLRRAHPETEEAMRQQRQDCLEVLRDAEPS